MPSMPEPAIQLSHRIQSVTAFCGSSMEIPWRPERSMKLAAMRPLT